LEVLLAFLKSSGLLAGHTGVIFSTVKHSILALGVPQPCKVTVLLHLGM
jgi:hypothetical protein